MKKFIVFFLMLLLTTPAFASKRESSSLDAKSVVLYGKDGNTLVPLKVDSDGNVSVSGGGGGSSQWSDGASSAIYYNSGNVGIGTSTPNTGQLTQKNTAALESPLGAELLSGTGWTATDWTGDFATGFTHTTGNTTALTNTLAAVSGGVYQIAYTVTGRTAGTFTITFGGVALAAASATGAQSITATSTGTLSVAPQSTFDGTLVLSIKRNIALTTVNYAIQDTTGADTFEIRTNLASLGNTFLGVNAGARNTTGVSNLFIGNDAGLLNTTGTTNVFIGRYAGDANTTGTANVFVGVNAGTSNTTGLRNIAVGGSALSSLTGANNDNVAIGVGALQVATSGTNTAVGKDSLIGLTTGTGNTSLGQLSGRRITTTNNNLFLGNNSGSVIADGTTFNTTPSDSVYLGGGTKAGADGQTNQIVIGYNAIGKGSNTAIIGNTSVTDTHVRGVRNTGTMTIIGATNNCILTVDADATCDAGTKIGEDNSIAICAVCAAN